MIPIHDHTAMIGHYVPYTYIPGYVVLSFLISLTGAWSTLEILHRRTGMHGFHNWFLMVSAAILMGGMAIWSMHYLGNRAIDIDGGDFDLQIEYSPGYTAGSFFLAIFGVLLAFYFFSVTEILTWSGTTLGGFFMGSAICGMHYMGQGGINNYTSVYYPRFVIGSALIAISASMVALRIFFQSKAKWTNTAVRRGGSAVLLATAVCGMHYCASAGTRYRLKNFNAGRNLGLSREHVVSTVICLSISACLVLLLLVFLSQRSKNRSADKAQQVVLACIIFNENGKVMVDADGLVPSRKITESFSGRAFEDVFDTNHPIFSWVFRASRSWSAVLDVLPAIIERARVSQSKKRVRKPMRSNSMAGVTPEEDYRQLFKVLFCRAAQELADSIAEPLTHLGVLYDDIMSTGTQAKETNFLSRLRRPRLNDLESGPGVLPVTIGRGQALFTVRRVLLAEERTHLRAAGYSFAEPQNVADKIARSMQVEREEILQRLCKMEAFVQDTKILDAGLHLACFALRPFYHGGFHVLVRKNAHNLMPSVPICTGNISRSQMNVLLKMNNWTIAKCLYGLENRCHFLDDTDKDFTRHLHDQLSLLIAEIGDPFFQQARLVAQQFRSLSRSSPTTPGDAFVIAFSVFTDAHSSSYTNERFEFTSLTSHMTQQHTYEGNPDIHVFSNRIRRELGVEVEAGSRRSHKRSSSQRSSFLKRNDFGDREPLSPGFKRWSPSRATLYTQHANPSERNLVRVSISEEPTESPTRVKNETNIELGSIYSCPDTADSIYTGEDAEASTSANDVEQESFVEGLFALTKQDRGIRS